MGAAPDASADKSSNSKTVIYAAVGVVLLVLVVVLAFCICKMRNNNGGGSNIAQAFRNPMYDMNNPTNSAAGSSNTFVGNANYADLPAAASNSVAYADVSGYDMSEA